MSLDGDSQGVYARQRPGGSLDKAHAACRAVRAAGLPLEITFAPTRINLHEAEAVIARARSLGAFRFNTGQSMRIGTAARHWDKLALCAEEYDAFRALLAREALRVGSEMEFCYAPFALAEALRGSLREPPATLLVLPNGWVKVAAALPQVCADLRRATLGEAWQAYRAAWREEAFRGAVRVAADNEARHAEANAWRFVTGVYV